LSDSGFDRIYNSNDIFLGPALDDDGSYNMCKILAHSFCFLNDHIESKTPYFAFLLFVIALDLEMTKAIEFIFKDPNFNKHFLCTWPNDFFSEAIIFKSEAIKDKVIKLLALHYEGLNDKGNPLQSKVFIFEPELFYDHNNSQQGKVQEVVEKKDLFERKSIQFFFADERAGKFVRSCLFARIGVKGSSDLSRLQVNYEVDEFHMSCYCRPCFHGCKCYNFGMILLGAYRVNNVSLIKEITTKYATNFDKYDELFNQPLSLEYYKSLAQFDTELTSRNLYNDLWLIKDLEAIHNIKEKDAKYDDDESFFPSYFLNPMGFAALTGDLDYFPFFKMGQ
jgi:hypothetical protein